MKKTFNTKVSALMKKSGFWALLLLVSLGGFVGAKKVKKAPAPVKKAKPKAKMLTVNQIIARMDANNVFGTRKALTIMKIFKNGRTRVKKLLSYSRGEDTSYSEFLSPARDKGVKYLKIKNNLWMYLPAAEKIIKISGHMLRQSMMGSDFSYEDMLDATALRERYTSKVSKIEKIDGHDCYLIVMKQKKKGETYPTRKVWVDKKLFVARRSELFAASGKLLKVSTVHNIKTIGKRKYATRVRMMNKLRKGTWTEIVLKKIEFSVKLPGGIFTKRNLESE
mgnify:CR=1 FL=1